MQQENLDNVFNFILNKKFRWGYHVLFWLMVFSVDLYSFYDSIYNFSAYMIITFLIEMIVVYFNIYFLFNKYLVKGKIFYYSLYTLLTVCLYLAIDHYLFYDPMSVDYTNVETGEKHPVLISSLGSLTAYAFRIFSVIGTAVGIKFFKRYFLEQKQIHAIKQDSLENELQYLKNQINPHFLFNSLNNIYVLSKKNQSTTSESILLLSDLLRYQLYDCTKKQVSLENEIDYLRNFLKLEELRKKNSDTNLSIEGDTFQAQVSPFIFMPFIENAIKYSGLTHNPKVDIQFKITDTQIHFLVFNNKADIVSVKKDSGIGLNNVKRRLFLLYENAHKLQIEENNKSYTVNLVLDKS